MWFRHIIAGVLLAIGAGAVAQVVPGGLPSRPTFQNLGVTATTGHLCPGGSDTALACVNPTTPGHTAWGQAIRPLGAAGAQLGLIIASSTGNNTDALFRIDTNGGIGTFQVLGDGTTVGFAEKLDSGAVTWSFTTASNPNCSAGGTNATVQLHKIGKIVVANITSFGSCSSAGATSFTTNNAPVPAAFRPTASSSCGAEVGSNAGGNVTVSACVTSAGNFQVSNLAGSTTLIGVLIGTFTYALD